MNVRNEVVLLFTLFAILVAGAVAAAKPGCRSTCGNLTIPYPFGVGAGCYLDEGFGVECDEATSTAYVSNKTLEMMITEISIYPAHVRYLTTAAHDCYKAGVNYSTAEYSVDLETLPYTFSSTENMLVATGCDTIAVIAGSGVGGYIGGCVSYCETVQGIVDGNCSGVGCCQSAIPKGLKRYLIQTSSVFNHNNTNVSNSCSFGFVADRNNYTFKLSDLNKTDTLWGHGTVLDWSVGNDTCQVAKSGTGTVNSSSYACVSYHSECVDADSGSGYNCKCSNGYQGNPYLSEGCQDVNECANRNICKGVCTNTPGSYSCVCPAGTHGNATGDGCFPDVKKGLSVYFKLGIGFGTSALLLAIIISWAYLGIQKRKLLKMKHHFFKHNGGLFLQEQLSGGQSNNFRIYNIEELKKATENFDPKYIVGRGGNGIVYKAVLHDQTTVAIKRSIMVDDNKSKEFANEMLILSQVNHSNVVRILGCCLEVEVPILVYEFVARGTLFHLIHNKKPDVPFPWDLRLKIATESAKALTYLHYDVSTTIFHGDVKSSNILLDEHLKAKVSDFGTSTLAPKDKNQFITLVQGTYGYLDPECLQTCQLTLKSDVYSFGVVLAELITGKKALYKDSSEGETGLASIFTDCVKNNSLTEILDLEIRDESSLPQIQVVADITVHCLSLRGDERPTMADVYMTLQALQRSDTHPWVAQIPEEIERLINGSFDSSTVDETTMGVNSYVVDIGAR